MQDIVDGVVREHVQLAAFQWQQRARLLATQPPDQDSVTDVDARLRANLDAIEIAGEAAWPFILEQIEDFPEAGELFVAGYLAVATKDAGRIEHCLRLVQTHPESRPGLAGALAWVPPSVSGAMIRRMIVAHGEAVRATAVEVLTLHRADPRERLPGLLTDPSPVVAAAACHLAAAVGRRDCSETIMRLAEASDPALRFAAAVALMSLGRPDAATSALKAEVETGSVRALDALRVLSRSLPPEAFRAYLGELYGGEATRALAVRGLGMTGDRTVLRWLLARMKEPDLAPAAGESFLELFPEAAGVEGLFSDSPAALGDAFQGLAEDGTSWPVAERIRVWTG